MSAPKFDHERLEVFQLELSFVAWVTGVLQEAKAAAPSFYREVCDQLDRASLSMLLNTAKGNGRRQGRRRAKFFDDARGSAVECAACLDASVAKEIVAAERIDEGKAMLVRIVSMLIKLVERFDDSTERLREDELNYPRPSSSYSLSSSMFEGGSEDENENEGRGRKT
ncbi:MAG TPA: four helix bundle protein [Terrimicrobiaceae bacterium]